MNIIRRCKYGLMIFNAKDVWQGRSFEVYGEYSESEVSLFKQVIPTGGTVIDVGANIGSHTVAFARIVGPQGLVVAFEPERNCFCTLCGNVAANNFRNVFCYQQALADKIGSIAVPEMDFDKTTNWGGLELDKDYSKGPHYTVTASTIDNIFFARCDFIKIDVEGMELDVLKGAEKTIDKFRPLLYVENDRKDKEESLLSKIRELNYTMYKHNAPFFNPENFYGVKDNVFGDVISVNLLCVPAERDQKINGLELIS